MLTNEELERIRERCEKATPGPWFYDEDREGSSMGWVGTEDNQNIFFPLIKIGGDSAQQYENAEFVTACRTDIPALLAHIEELDRRSHD